jgi:hypothetical protein
MTRIGSSFHRSLLSLVALAMGATLFIGFEARAANSTLVVPVSGTVSDDVGSMFLSGQATIESTLIQDEFGGAPSVILSIHVTNVTGRGVSGSGEAVLIRTLAASDTVEVPLLYGTPGAQASGKVRSATATLTLIFDAKTGAALSATGAFASPLAVH